MGRRWCLPARSSRRWILNSDSVTSANVTSAGAPPGAPVSGPDVEALLVNRVGSARDHYRAPIDVCYKLVGLLRTRWQGLSGGTEVWKAIGEFFSELRKRSNSKGASHDA